MKNTLLNWNKKMFVIFILQLLFICTISAQNIIFSTSKAVGESILILIKTDTPGTIEIDYGDGVKVSATVTGNINMADNLSGTVKGSTIRIYGNAVKILSFQCVNSGITSMNLSNAVDLVFLWISGNSISSLNLSKCTELEEFSVSYNKIGSIDVSGNTKLKSLIVDNNNLYSLDVTNCPNLETLSFAYNQVFEIDLTNNTKLQWLYCDDNSLNELDVSTCVDLIDVSCRRNSFSSLDFSNLTFLERLNCYGFNSFSSNLITLNVDNCTSLTYLDCAENKINSLDLTSCPKLQHLNCYRNSYIPSLDLSNCPELLYINCSQNRIPDLDFTNCTKVTYLDCSNNEISSLNVSTCLDLEALNCRNNKLPSLFIDNCVKLTQLICASNKIPSLNLTNLTVLQSLDCEHNPIPNLDVTYCPELTSLDFWSCKITTIDLSKATKLRRLTIGVNPLISIDLSACPELERIQGIMANLTSLDLSANPKLKELFLGENKLTSLDLSNNPLLTNFSCNSNRLKFSTIPLQPTISLPSLNVLYVPQAPIEILKSISPTDVIDLSSEYLINGNTTNYTWKTYGGATTLVEGRDYINNNGKFIFSIVPTDSIYCEMTNATFPNFINHNVLKTTYFKIVDCSSSQNYSVLSYAGMNDTLSITSGYKFTDFGFLDPSNASKAIIDTLNGKFYLIPNNATITDVFIINYEAEKTTCVQKGSIAITKTPINIYLLDSCSFEPKLSADVLVSDFDLTWEFSLDGTTNWTAIAALAGKANVIAPLKTAHYRLTIKRKTNNDNVVAPPIILTVEQTTVNNRTFYTVNKQ